MPSSLTHYGFNKEMYNGEISFLKGNEDVYLVGGQGPDPFMFRGFIPSCNSKNASIIRQYGHRLHKLDPKDVFSFFFKCADNSKNKDVLYSYILGAGLHYVLDRKVHPYVFYRTGFSEDKVMRKVYFANHSLFETHLDVLLMEGIYREYKVSPIEAIKCDEDKIEAVSDMYKSLAKKLVVEENIDDNSFEDSYKEMVNIEKILYSKRGIKKGIVNFLFKGSPLNTMMHPLSVKDNAEKDYLNVNNGEWRDPCTGVIFNKSVYELINESKQDAKEWIKVVVDAYNGNFNYEEISKFTNEMIYDGYKEGEKMKFFDESIK